jgi:VanZ family protein
MATREAHRSAAVPLALAYAALVVYASLYPFSGARWPPGHDALALLIVPWHVWGDAFDVWSNALGYLPLGALIAIALLRSGFGAGAALACAVLVPTAMSYALEVLQHVMPTRHPSLKDWALNAGGATAGTLLAWALHRLGAVDRWNMLRERWFAHDSAGALALLALWPMGLLFPAPVPLGLGQFDGRLRETLAAWLEGVPWAEAAHAMLAAPESATRLSPLAEAGIMALGLLAPCLLAYSIVAPGWRRLAMAFGAVVLAAAGMTLSTLLNFGPQHALAWITPWAGPAIGAAVLLALLLAPWRRSVVLGVALMVLTGLVVGVAHAPADPYFAQSLQAWEQGRFVRFHGLAQWIGWLWPYAAIGWLLSRLAVRR